MKRSKRDTDGDGRSAGRRSGSLARERKGVGTTPFAGMAEARIDPDANPADAEIYARLAALELQVLTSAVYNFNP